MASGNDSFSELHRNVYLCTSFALCSTFYQSIRHIDSGCIAHCWGRPECVTYSNFLRVVCKIVSWTATLCTLNSDHLASCYCLLYRIVEKHSLKLFAAYLTRKLVHPLSCKGEFSDVTGIEILEIFLGESTQTPILRYAMKRILQHTILDL